MQDYSLDFNLQSPFVFSVFGHLLFLLLLSLLVKSALSFSPESLEPKGVLVQIQSLSAEKPRVSPRMQAQVSASQSSPVESSSPSKKIGNVEESESVGVAGKPEGQEASIQKRYLYELRLFINQNKRYPRSAKTLRQEGSVLVTFVVDRKGLFKEISLNQSSGFSILDEETLRLIRSLKQFRPIPSEIPQSEIQIRLPIVYALR